MKKEKEECLRCATEEEVSKAFPPCFKVGIYLFQGWHLPELMDLPVHIWNLQL